MRPSSDLSVRPFLHLGVAGAALLAGLAAGNAQAQQRQAFPPLPLTPAAQEAAPLTFTLSQSLVADTNYNLDVDSPGITYYGETRLGFDYVGGTDNQRIGFGLDTGVRGIDQPGEGFDWVAASPSSAYVTYRGEGSDALFDADLRARSRQVNSTTFNFDPDVPDNTPDSLNQINNDAREYRTDANIGFTLGTNSPSTYGLRLIATNTTYDETGGNLTPRYIVNPQANWQMELSPLVTAAVYAGYFYYNADNDAQTTINLAEGDAGLVYTPSDRARVGFGIGYADRRQTEIDNGVKQDDNQTGPVVRADLRYVLPDFTVTGNVRYSTAAPSNNRFSGFLSAFYALPRGSAFGRIYQRATGDDTGTLVRVTGAVVGVTRNINTVSSVGLSVDWATQVNVEDQINVPDESGDITRTNFTANYTYNFTETVAGEFGYIYQTNDEGGTASGSQVYVQIGKTFETGF